MMVVAALGQLCGWRRRLVLMLLGGLAALALPPVHALPVLFVALPGLLLLLEAGSNRWAAFGAGWWFGMGFFPAGLYWISIALLTEPEKFAWMIPFAVFGLGGVLACFTGAATWLARRAVPGGAGLAVALAGSWTLMEWLRSWIFTGFPWNVLGSVWDLALPVLQIGAAVGVYGLSLITVLGAGMAVVLVEPMAGRRKAALLGLAFAPLLLGSAWGALRLAEPAAQPVPGVRLRLVQAAIAQSHKWREELRQMHLDMYVALSTEGGQEGITHVIWPETAAPYFLDIDDDHRAQVEGAVPSGGLVITGAPRITPKGVLPFRLWNAMMAIDGQGEVAAVYDKVHLVPFGEYAPMSDILPIIKIAWGAVDFSPGPGLRTLSLPGLPPVSPLICYEAIFPAEVVGPDQERPAWLLNLTNDAWFGMSSGPYQHLAAARMRAIEEGLPLVRSANTGISAVFDGKGRQVARLGLGEYGTLDSFLPEPEVGLTPYARIGNTIPLILAIFAIGLASCAGRWRLRRLTCMQSQR